MARAAATQATLAVEVAVFSFDSDPGILPSRALHVLTDRHSLPGGALSGGERFAEAAIRCAAAAGVDLGARRRGRGAQAALTLVGLDDEPARPRAMTAWFVTTAPYDGAAHWSPIGRGLRLSGGSTAALRAAVDRLRVDTRTVAGAAELLGDVFTGDDLLRLHVALHGGPEGSERTFRRRVQELRDGGVLRPVRDAEIIGLRERTVRFRSPAGTGGRPPELLRYSGGGDGEGLAGLRARRKA